MNEDCAPTTPVRVPLRSSAAIRTRRFVQLLCAAAIVGAVAGWREDMVWLALVPFTFAWFAWVVADLRANGTVDGRFVFHLLVAVVPVAPPLLYFVVTRRLTGILHCLAFLVAVEVPAGLAGMLAHGIAQVARGGRW